MTLWWLIVILAGWTFLLRIAGPLFLRRVDLPEGAGRVMNNITPAVLSALIMAGIFGVGNELVIDERAFGFAAAVAGAIAKLPPLVVILVAAGATAAARAVTS